MRSREDEVNDDTSFEVDSYLAVVKEPILGSYYTVGDLINRTEVLGHPFTYMSTLVQIGFEPLPPTLSTSIFGRPQYKLPGLFTYLRFIADTDGIAGLWRGIGYNLSYNIGHGFVYANVSNYQKEHFEVFKPLKDKNAKYKNVTNLALSLSLETITKILSLAAAYPFHVMMVRSMAQFVGRETHYDFIFGAIADIYQTGGILGFYAGVVPLFIGECLLLYIESGMIYLLKNNKQVDKTYFPFIVATLNMVARSLMYPFRIVSTVMACNGSSARSLAASAYTAPEFGSWIQCWASLWNANEIKRGSSLIWRYQPLSTSYAFNLRPMSTVELKAKGSKFV